MKIIDIQMTYQKSTKNKHVYAESKKGVVVASTDTKIAGLYIARDAFGNNLPRTISVVVTDPEERS